MTACSAQGEAQGEPIACAVGHPGDLSEQCRLERTGQGKSAEFVVHHPDGGFRRFFLAPDGKGLMPADGADAARSVIGQGVIDLTVGQDRYRIAESLLETTDER